MARMGAEDPVGLFGRTARLSLSDERRANFRRLAEDPGPSDQPPAESRAGRASAEGITGWVADLGHGEPSCRRSRLLALRDSQGTRRRNDAFPDPFGEGWEDRLDVRRRSDELMFAVESTWSIVESCLERWTPEMLAETFPCIYPDRVQLHTRQSVLTRPVMHDAFHCVEASLLLGMHGLASMDPWGAARLAFLSGWAGGARWRSHSEPLRDDLRAEVDVDLSEHAGPGIDEAVGNAGWNDHDLL